MSSPARKTTVPPSPKVTPAGHKQTQSGEGKLSAHKHVETSSPALSKHTPRGGLQRRVTLRMELTLEKHFEFCTTRDKWRPTESPEMKLPFLEKN